VEIYRLICEERGRMDWSEADASHQDWHEGSDYRRIEVITGRRKRRSWTPAEKARIVAETAAPGANISAVARDWGVSRGLLTVWRRQAGLVKAKAPAERAAAALEFVPITIAGEDRQPDHDSGRRKEVASELTAAPAGRIELEIDGSRLVLTGSVDPAVAVAIVGALRAAR
jgi:transposase